MPEEKISTPVMTCMKIARLVFAALALFGLGFLTSGLVREGNRRADVKKVLAFEGIMWLGAFRLLHESIASNDTAQSLEAVRMLMSLQRDKLLSLDGLPPSTSASIDEELKQVEPILVAHGKDLPVSIYPFRYTVPPPKEEEPIALPDTDTGRPRKILPPP